jgi:hypothetical protein
LATLYGGPRIYRGLEQIEAVIREWLTAWDRYWMTGDDFIEGWRSGRGVYAPPCSVGGHRRRVRATHHGGVDAAHGRAVRVRYYDDQAEAVEAVGLIEVVGAPTRPHRANTGAPSGLPATTVLPQCSPPRMPIPSLRRLTRGRWCFARKLSPPARFSEAVVCSTLTIRPGVLFRVPI